MMACRRGLAPAWSIQVILIACVACVIAGEPARAVPAQGDDDLANGIRLVKSKKYDDAIDPLNAAIRAFTADNDRRQAARAYLYLAAVYVEMEQKLAAKAAVYSALRQDTTVPLEPEQFSSGVEKFIRDTAKDYVPQPTPTPVPTPVATPPPTPTPRPAASVPPVLAPSSDAELERDVALVRGGHFGDAIVSLEATATRLRDEGADRQVFARAQLYLAAALLGAGRDAEARDAAYLVLAIFPGLDLTGQDIASPALSEQTASLFASLR
jgi:tetratricopeptide (TPR) repeat protein